MSLRDEVFEALDSAAENDAEENGGAGNFRPAIDVAREILEYTTLESIGRPKDDEDYERAAREVAVHVAEWQRIQGEKK